MVTGNSMLTRQSLTFSVELAIYLPGLSGARIEENVAVTPDGVDVLTSYPRELRTL